MRRISLYFYVILFATCACKKNVDESNNNEWIQMSNYDGMNIISYDTIIEGDYPYKKSIYLDINNDLTDDFKLSSYVWGSPGQGEHPKVSLASLNSNSLINGSLTNDTTFYYLNINSSWHNENTTEIIYEYNYSCRKNSNYDSVASVNYGEFKIDYLNNNDFLYKSGEYRSDTITLTENWERLPGGNGTPNSTNDTITYEIYRYTSNCINTIPKDNIFYIAIKQINNNIEKIGWIKLGVYEECRIFLVETAIQK